MPFRQRVQYNDLRVEMEHNDVCLRSVELDMRLWPKPRTDEEYVELVRKRMSRRKAFVALHICTVLLFVLLFLLSVAFLSWFLSRIPKDMEHMEQLFAVIDGKMAGWMLSFGGCCLILGVRHFRGPRAEHLMIQFHAELVQNRVMATSQIQAAGNQDPPDGR